MRLPCGDFFEKVVRQAMFSEDFLEARPCALDFSATGDNRTAVGYPRSLEEMIEHDNAHGNGVARNFPAASARVDPALQTYEKVGLHGNVLTQDRIRSGTT